MIKKTTLLQIFMASTFAFACGSDSDSEEATSNTAPVANAGKDAEYKNGQQVTLDGSASSDADNDPLTFKWTASSQNPATVTLSEAKTAKPKFTAPETAGKYTFSLVVNDGKTDSKADQVDITVSVTPTEASNTKPVADAGKDQTVTAGDEVTLDGSASSDTDKDELKYKWTVSGQNPEAVTLSDASVAQPKFTAPTTAGEYTFNLVVNDGKDDSESASVKVTVKEPEQTGASITYADISREGVLFLSATHGNGTFVAVGYYGKTLNSEDRGSVHYSEDGVTWTEVADVTGGTSWQEVIFANNQFVMVGDNGAVATSPDGVTWTKSQTNEQWDWKSVSYQAPNYIFTASKGRYGVSNGSDLVNLTVKRSDYVDDEWNGQAYGNNVYVTVGKDGRVGYSDNGKDWDFKTIDKSSYRRFGDVTYGKHGFVATVSQGSTTVATSTDGKAWTLKTNSLSFQGVEYLDGKYVLLGTHLKDEGLYFSEGLDFDNAEKIELEGRMLDVVFAEGKYIVVGSKVAVVTL
ncbi:hypothetical protein FUAX_02140 [Fulvitalea axinellae]|uniref:PKD/Chitinase domain-containing protein n=1 Tax=Fulvitalea axinellae TaxID=1182444 RepID=A0AAU9CIV0_9BACT|nr:hypothetical protein FUAX_02140 [Fulvitalea axinellae]